MSELLEIKNLNITFRNMNGELKAVTDLNFNVKRGEILGLIGESGSGKSVTAKAIMHLLEGGKVTGDILYHGINILQMKEKEICKIRGLKIAMIFQEPMTALNPVVKIGKQLEEILKIHEIGNRDENIKKIKETLRMLNINNPDAMIKKYPFELSGGLKQRIVIAMAVLCQPEIIIADEPTTALDVTTQKEILLLLRKTAKNMGSTVLLITHDLGVVAECADRMIVMYRGKKMEECKVEQFFHNALHPYSRGLIASRPSNFDGRYYTIKGSICNNYGEMKGCPYAERCDECLDKCREKMPEEKEISQGHYAACWNV
ncbi:ABC transporter ATP-binding protein [Roseburia hominis]